MAEREATRASDEESVTLAPPGGARPAVQRGRTLGRYVLGNQVGAGAMGIVFRAFDPQLERWVAVKLLTPESGHRAAVYRERLMREARSLARIEHPNVVTVHDVGVLGEQVFIAMEFVDGGDLRDWMRGRKDARPRPWREVLSRFLAAGEGLVAAHRSGLVHRDFKPANVLVRSDGRVLVSDFGLVRDASAATLSDADAEPDDGAAVDLTATGTVLGTPAYMAPEQFAGADADARSDQFAFCVALWEALSLRRPFWPEKTSELYGAERREPPDPPDDDVPRVVYKALCRGLACDPDQRFEDIQELLDELRRGLRPRRSWARWSLVGALAAAAIAGVAYQAGTHAEPVAGPVAGALDYRFELDFAADAQALDAEAGPSEKAGLTGPDVAELQYRRALAHLAAFEEVGEARHLQVAHELLVRLEENVYGAPHPEDLKGRATAKLAEIRRNEAGLEKAEIELEPLTRFGLVVLQRHGKGAQVRTNLMPTQDDELICVQPCTVAVPVGKGAAVLRVERAGEVVQQLAWNPQHHLQNPAGF